MGKHRAPRPPRIDQIEDAVREQLHREPVKGEVIRWGHKDGKLVVESARVKPFNVDKEKARWWWPF